MITICKNNFFYAHPQCPSQIQLSKIKTLLVLYIHQHNSACKIKIKIVANPSCSKPNVSQTAKGLMAEEGESCGLRGLG
jgi:hypothetical protein